MSESSVAPVHTGVASDEETILYGEIPREYQALDTAGHYNRAGHLRRARGPVTAPAHHLDRRRHGGRPGRSGGLAGTLAPMWRAAGPHASADGALASYSWSAAVSP